MLFSASRANCSNPSGAQQGKNSKRGASAVQQPNHRAHRLEHQI